MEKPELKLDVVWTNLMQNRYPSADIIGAGPQILTNTNSGGVKSIIFLEEWGRECDFLKYMIHNLEMIYN